MKIIELEDVIKKNNLPTEEFEVNIFCINCCEEKLCLVKPRYDGHSPHRGRVIHCRKCQSQGGCAFYETSIVYPYIKYEVMLALAFEDNQYKLVNFNKDSIYPSKLGSYQSLNQVNEVIKNYLVIK